MKIALVMEWSTCTKNEIVYETLKKVAEANGHTVVNYGQFDMDDNRQTYQPECHFNSCSVTVRCSRFRCNRLWNR